VGEVVEGHPGQLCGVLGLSSEHHVVVGAAVGRIVIDRRGVALDAAAGGEAARRHGVVAVGAGEAVAHVAAVIEDHGPLLTLDAVQQGAVVDGGRRDGGGREALAVLVARREHHPEDGDADDGERAHHDSSLLKPR
jgi:hypothetical protein